MKKILLSFIICCGVGVYSQQYEVTPNGLRDKGNLENTFVVIETQGKTAEELYINAIRYINENYKNPDEVMKGKTENEYLRFETFVPNFTKVNNSGAKITVNLKYTTELRFKDDKVRYEITDISIPARDYPYEAVFTGGALSGYPIFRKKDGKLRLPETKEDIETHFNNRILNLKNFLLDVKTPKDDW